MKRIKCKNICHLSFFGSKPFIEAEFENDRCLFHLSFICYLSFAVNRLFIFQKSDINTCKFLIR